jgi:hypothetical protein
VAGANVGSATVSTSDGQFSLTGRIGVYSTGASFGTQSWTVAASAFQFPTGSVSPSNASFQGDVAGVLRKAEGDGADAFLTSTTLPGGTVLQGRQLSLRYDTYHVVGSTAVQNGISQMFEIDRVDTSGGQTRVHLTRDPQLTMSGSGAGATATELVAPERSFDGPFTFEISTSASSGATPTPTPTSTPTPTPTSTPTPTPTATATSTPTATATPNGYVEVTPATATASTNDGNVPANAVDDNLTTRC